MTPQTHLPGCDGHHTSRQACNNRAADAVPAHLSREAVASAPAAAVATAPVEAAAAADERRAPPESSRAIADGPVDTIDTQHIPALPLLGLVLLTLASLVLLWRLFSRQRRD